MDGGGDTIKRRKVYAHLRDPATGKRVLAHRYLAEQALGRPLLPREVVHHRDGDSLNNDPANLIVLPSQRVHAHAEFHLRRLQRGMPSLFPELFQVIPSDTWGTLFANVLVWQGQEPPLSPRGIKPVRPPIQIQRGLLEMPSEQEITLVTPETHCPGSTTLAALLTQIRVRVQQAGQVNEYSLLKYHNSTTIRDALPGFRPPN